MTSAPLSDFDMPIEIAGRDLDIGDVWWLGCGAPAPGVVDVIVQASVLPGALHREWTGGCWGTAHGGIEWRGCFKVCFVLRAQQRLFPLVLRHSPNRYACCHCTTRNGPLEMTARLSDIDSHCACCFWNVDIRRSLQLDSSGEARGSFAKTPTGRETQP